MKKVYDRSFKIIAALFIFSLFSAIGFQSYLYFKNYEINNFQETKADIQNESRLITTNIKKLGAKKFDLFKTSERFSMFKNIDEKIEDISDKLNFKNDYSNTDNLDKLAEEISGVNHNNKGIWNNYTEGFLAYNKFVKSNKWKTLTRISNRINIRSPRKFNFEKDINYLLGINLKDLSLAQDVVKKSSLDNNTKKEILDKTDNLIIQTNLLIEENAKASKVRNSYLLTLNNFEAWSNFWSKNGQQYLSAPNYAGKVSAQFFILSILMLLAFLGVSIFLMRKIFMGFQEKSQREIIFALDKIIVKDDLSFIGSKEEDFKNAVQTLNNYVKRRMSLGQIFQQTMPFPSMLLDENLNFKWFNQYFIEQLNFSEDTLASENMNWDKIKDLFLLGGHDPVMEAIEGNVAGIFQVKTEQNKSFQMYINPVNYNHKKYVMVVLYPLLTVEDTIDLKVSSSLEPVKKSVAALKDGLFDKEFSQAIKPEFAMTSGLDLWNDFDSLSQELAQQKQNYQREMQNFEKVTIEALNSSEYTSEVLGACRSEVDKLQGGFGSLKEVIINFSSRLNETIQSTQKVFSEISNYTNTFAGNAKKDVDLDKTIEKLIQWGIPSISEFKAEIKSYRDQLKMIGRTDNSEAQKYLKKQEKLLRDTDLFFTKFDMFLEDLRKLSKQEDTSNYTQIEELKGKVLNETEVLNSRVQEQADSEEQLVDLMKGFYSNVVRIQKTYKSIEKPSDSVQVQH